MLRTKLCVWRLGVGRSTRLSNKGKDEENMEEIDNDVMGQIMFQQAQNKYPYLSNKDISFAYNPQEGDRKLEFYHPEETERPVYIPAGKPGIEVFNPNVTPEDILGDYVSHYGVSVDPKLKGYYEQFEGLLDPIKMQKRYQYHQENFGENRPYENWKQMTGVPEMFRGYTFNQWPDAAQMYTPEQLQILNQVRSYLGIK